MADKFFPFFIIAASLYAESALIIYSANDQ
jgi:hypothetical protein